MEEQHKHAIRAAIFIIISFFIIPDLVPWIARKISPGGLALPEFPYVNGAIFAAILTIVVIYKNYETLRNIKGPSSKNSALFSTLSIVFLSLFTIFHYVGFANITLHIILAWLMYAAATVSLAAAILGMPLIKTLGKDFTMAAAALIGYIGFTLIIDSTRFHYITASIAVKILSYFTDVSIVLLPLGDPQLKLETFTANIGPPCSGIFSIVLFTAIFSFVYWLDHKKINGKKAMKFYIIGVIGAYLLNLLRVVALILIGAYWSPKIAVGAFHTNAGWILFAAYSLGYWFFVYPRIIRK